MASTAQLLLASGSPRRAALLRQLGVRFVARSVAVDETCRSAETPAHYVARLAQAKAAAGQVLAAGLPVLGSDTCVAIDGHIFGKPADQADARRMLSSLSARAHQVFSAVCIVAAGPPRTRVQVSTVRFRAIGAEETAAYWQTGEPQDKAGGYAIQGRGAVFVEHLSGSYSGVMGLPLFETAALLNEIGIECLG